MATSIRELRRVNHVKPTDTESEVSEGDAANPVVPDGGTQDEELFNIKSDITRTRSERYHQIFDQQIVAPLRIMWEDGRAKFAVAVLSVYFVMAAVAWLGQNTGIILVEKPSPAQGGLLELPFQSLEHPLGTSMSGSDLLSDIIYATLPMMKMVFAGAVFSTVTAALVGTTAGYKGGTIDKVLMIFADIMLTLPGLPLIIVLATALELGGNPYAIGVLITINAWAGLSRTIRSQVLTIREESFVEASRILGHSTPRILFDDVIPGLMPYITINFVQSARNVIFGSVALYFIGILPYTQENWGVMMNKAYAQAGAVSSPGAYHALYFPMAAVVLLALSLTLLAQSSDRVFNPRARARHAETIDDDDTDATVSE